MAKINPTVPAYMDPLRKAMKSRCYNPNNRSFPNYGGRGIQVCQRWRDSLLAFWQDMGPRPSSKYTIERIDNDGDYGPENCCWATRKEQARNRPGWNYSLTHDSKTACAAEHAEDVGLMGRQVRKRLALGWSTEDALTVPLKTFVSATKRLEGLTKERLLSLKAKHGTWGAVAIILECPPATFQRLRKRFDLTPLIPQRRHNV